MSARSPWPVLLALPLGYLLGWFLYGIAAPALLLTVLGAALLLSVVAGRGRGVAGFLRLLLLLLLSGVMAGVAGGVLTLFAFVTSPDNPLPVGLPQALVAAVLGLAVVLACVWLLRRLARSAPEGARATSPAAPWLLVAGVLLFAFFPAVRVDCRGMQADSFLSYSSGFSGISAAQSYWARKPHLIPNRAQLPADFGVDSVRASVTRCFQDARGRPRPLSFRASAPLLVVHLMERVRPGMQSYAAVFTPGDHRKLTPWMRAEPPYGQLRPHKPYFFPGWVVYPELPTLPPALARELER
ncbi:hypothetical protein Dcar01_00384 [Deinococcus carri]|uniref:Uncharacterized protein n=1 Tax=Deinococcus carri TaxID=1211323 RepID=A0ABP9W6A6_9DEIO